MCKNVQMNLHIIMIFRIGGINVIELVLYFLHSTPVLSFYIDVILTLSITT